MSLQPISEIQGVKFFDHASSCVAHFEKTHWSKKAISLIQSFGTLLFYALNKISLALRRMDAQMEPFTNSDNKGFFNKKLIVCIHGLNSNPSQFKEIIDEMQKKELSETDIFIPRVLQKGNAKLDEMVKPIFEEIVKWSKTCGEKELVLVGVSNGGRISRAIEAELSKSPINIQKLRFVSIVGACRGSSLVNLANKIGLSCLISKNISEEMPKDSLRNQRLDQEWTNGLSKGPTREYTFIASPHDWQVTNYDSSLMEVRGQRARYAIVPGHGHNSIVNAVAKSVAEIALS